MRALVTGVGGFLGAHLAARLAADGWQVRGLARPASPPWRLATLGLEGRVATEAVDLARPLPPETGYDVDVAFLLAATRAGATAAERRRTALVNVLGAQQVVEALGPRCRAVVWVGSSTEYGAGPAPMAESAPLAPRGYFGATKAAGSLLVAATAAARGLRSVVLRAFQVFGPLDHPGRLVPAALAAARTGTVLPLTVPGRCRDWVFVDDVVAACTAAASAEALAPGAVLNIGTGRQVANEELVAEVERVTGREVRVAVGAHPGRAWDAERWVCDPTRARQLLGWRARVGLDEGLARCWAWATA